MMDEIDERFRFRQETDANATAPGFGRIKYGADQNAALDA